MKEYDSILKEKKVYEEKPEKSKSKYVFLYFVIMIIVLGIYYIIYYQKVLTPNNILLHDINTVIKKYQTIFDQTKLEIEDDQKLEGTFLLNDLEYNCGLLKEEASIKIELSNATDYFTYLGTEQAHYLELSSLPNQKIKLNELLTLEEINNWSSKINTVLPSERYSKKIYLEETTPIVEVSTTITTNDINQLLGNSHIQENYEILVTLKNHALKNQLLYAKIILNNKTTSERNVYIYQNNNLEYTDTEGKHYKITLTQTQEDFNLKIYKEEELYSIFLGKRLENTYQYTYQIIDRIYNITLDITKETSGYQYQLTSNIEKDGVKQQNTAKLSLYKVENTLTEEQNHPIIDYQNLSSEEQNTYQEFFSNFLLPFRNFINNHQTDINNL